MPIKFEIYRDGARVESFTPVAAMGMGPESVPIPGDVVFRDGLLILSRGEEFPAGVSLVWDMGELGSYQLETTRLPPRSQPYNLNVELARCRLMKIVQKQEDWNLFDFPRTEKYMQRFREAQAIFADALGKLHIPAEAARLADEALVLAMDLGDQLALFHADLLLARRRAANGLPKHVLGCRIDPTIQTKKYKDTLLDGFDYAVVPLSWKLLQPEEGVFTTDLTDEWLDILAKKRMPVIGGPLIDLSDVPDWVFLWEHDFESLREFAYEFVQKVVAKYRRHVAVWNVVAGLHTNSAFTLSFEQTIELTRLLVAQVKSIQPNARTIVTITQPWGEYHAKGQSSVPPILYAEMVAQAGVNCEAFGLEIEQGVPSRGGWARDTFQLSCLLDKFSTIGRPVLMTALGCSGRSSPDPEDRSEGKLDASFAGRWKKPWDASLQADWMDSVYRLALSKPFVESIAWANLADANATLPAGGLLDSMLKPKPAFAKIQEIRESLRAKK